jgi:hypothetical protein
VSELFGVRGTFEGYGKELSFNEFIIEKGRVFGLGVGVFDVLYLIHM